MGDSTTVPCPTCSGRGTIAAFVDREAGGHYDPALRCHACQGTGAISHQTADWMARGRRCRDARVKRGESLRDCAARHGFTPAVLSAMEHGRSDPAPLESPNWVRAGRDVPRCTALYLRSETKPELGEYVGALFPDREDHRIGYWMTVDAKHAVETPTHWRKP